MLFAHIITTLSVINKLLCVDNKVNVLWKWVSGFFSNNVEKLAPFCSRIAPFVELVLLIGLESDEDDLNKVVISMEKNYGN